MTKSIISGLVALLCNVILCVGINGQAITDKTTANDALRQAARQLISSSSTCALITLDNEGQPRARAMDPFAPENDFTIWLGTNPKSRKVKHIKNDPRVSLYYLADDETGYVVIYGHAQMVNDSIEKQQHWKEEWQAFYANKETDYTLIKVTPLSLEVVWESAGILGDTLSWGPPKIDFKAD